VGTLSPERLAERLCHQLDIPSAKQAESLAPVLREALRETHERAVAATKTTCLEIAEDGAERCRRVGASAAPQTALTIAARIRRRHVEVRS